MKKSGRRKKKGSKSNADNIDNEGNEDVQHPPSCERAPMEKENCFEEQADIQHGGERMQLSHSPRSEPGGALLLQQAMELEYPRFIGESSKTPKTSSVDVAHKALEARLQSTGKDCPIKESKAMMQRFSTNKSGSASNTAVLFTTTERPVCSHSTSVIVHVHQVASNEPCRQFGGETASATAVTDAAYCQLTKTRSSFAPSVTQKHTSGLVEEVYPRTVAPERTMVKQLDQPTKCPREDGISTEAVAPDRSSTHSVADYDQVESGTRHAEENEMEAAQPKLKWDFSSLEPADLTVFQVHGINLLDYCPSIDPRKFNLDRPSSKPIKVKFYDEQGKRVG